MQRVGTYHIKPFSINRKNIAMLLKTEWKKHSIHSLIEIDVTKGRKKLKEYMKKNNEKLSFTAWICTCAAKAICEHKELNSYRKGKNKIIYFDDVDISIPLERTSDNEKILLSYILRRANEKSLLEISKELRSVQKQKIDEEKQVLFREFTKLEKIALKSPLFIKKILLSLLNSNPKIKKKHMGTIIISSVGMKGKRSGWFVPVGNSSAMLFAIGGITKKPGIIKNEMISVREYLHVTITVDHDIVDGAPFTRFVNRFIDLCENGYGIPE